MSQASQTGRPGRYPRTTGGLVGSIIVLVLVVIAVVLFRGAFRQTPTYEPDHLDYRAFVTSVQQAGIKPVYPAALPAGWYVKDATFSSGDRPVVDLAMNTGDGRYSGLHQEDRGVDELVATYVGGDATQGADVQIGGTVAPTWQTFSDPGGDHAFAAQVDGQTVLVYGSTSEAQLRSFVGSLTTARLEP